MTILKKVGFTYVLIAAICVLGLLLIFPPREGTTISKVFKIVASVGAVVIGLIYFIVRLEPRLTRTQKEAKSPWLITIVVILLVLILFGLVFLRCLYF